MGIILSRVRKKKSAVETLEKLDNDIKEIEENGVNARRKYEKITRLFFVFSVGLYVLFGIVLYFHFTSTLQEKLLYLVPLAISPLLLYTVKRIISWYFARLLNKNQKRLIEMRKEKKKILDEVMDKETYKVAKEILEKFSVETVPKPKYDRAHMHKPDEGLRKRLVTVTSSVPGTQPNNRVWMGSQPPQPIMSNTIPNRPNPAPATPLLPAPILPLNRSYMDKIVEYLIGDGPNNRYALICSQCHSHNGMALKEEFEYIGFKCCYCFSFNPARKVRPEAPKLEFPSKLREEYDSEAEKTSDENSEEDQNPALDEKPFNIGEDSEIANPVNGDDTKTAETNIQELNDGTHQDSNAHTDNLEETEVQKFSGEHISSSQPEGDSADCDESSVKS